MMIIDYPLSITNNSCVFCRTLHPSIMMFNTRMMVSAIIIAVASLATLADTIEAFAPQSYLSSASLTTAISKQNEVHNMMNGDDGDDGDGDDARQQSSFHSSGVSRRSLLVQLATVVPATAATAAATAGSLLSLPSPSFAADDPYKIHISAYWKSVDGLNSLDSSKKFVSFDASSYTAMMDGKKRNENKTKETWLLVMRSDLFLN